MGKIGSIKIKSIDELRATTTDTSATPTTTAITASATISFLIVDSDSEDDFAIETPAAKKLNKIKSAATTSKKTVKVKPPTTPEKTNLLTTTNRKVARTTQKEPPPGQKRIDNFFKSANKTYTIKPETRTPDKWNSTLKQEQLQSSAKKSSVKGRKGAATKKGRKRLFEEDTESSASTCSLRGITPPKSTRKRSKAEGGGVHKGSKKTVKKSPVKRKLKKNEKVQEAEAECIDLCSDSENDVETTLKIMEEDVRAELACIKREKFNMEEELRNEMEQEENEDQNTNVNPAGLVETQSERNEEVLLTNKDKMITDVRMDQEEEKEDRPIQFHKENELRAANSLNEMNKDQEDKQAPTDNGSNLNQKYSPVEMDKAEQVSQNLAHSQRVLMQENAVATLKKSQLQKQSTDDESTQVNVRDTDDVLNSQTTPTANSQESLLTQMRDSNGKIMVRTDSSLQSMSVALGNESESLPTKTTMNSITTTTTNQLTNSELEKSTRATTNSITTTTTLKSTALTLGDDEIIEIDLTDDNEVFEAQVETSSNAASSSKAMKTNGVTTRVRKKHPCPPYKKIEGTTFAVDGFRYGQIEGVTHYFLTHFHADHYIGLTRKFAMPLYLNSMTARFLRTFIPIEEQYIHELEMYKPEMIEGIEVTAIDANHCPGAAMFVFKLPDGKCILHTGDFRACADMESEPIFWNNDIHTIYLDTTYLSDKYSFCTQYESIDAAKNVVRKFQAKHEGKRILYVCGSYLVGKEKFWQALAIEFKLTVWAEQNRRKTLDAMESEEMTKLLRDTAEEANFHIVPLAKLSFWCMVDYFKNFSAQYDTMLAFRPSGWEKNSKPQLRGEVNIVGVEYSEHSSHNELKRFVMFLKPQKVISTVPLGGGKDMMKTPEVPQKWYKYNTLAAAQRNFQPSITSYLKLNKRNSSASGSEAPENSTAESLIKKRLAQNAAADAAIVQADVNLQCTPPPKAKRNDCDQKQRKHQKIPLADNMLHSAEKGSTITNVLNSAEKTSVTPKSSPLSLFAGTLDAMAGSEAMSPNKINEQLKYFDNEDAFDDWMS